MLSRIRFILCQVVILLSVEFHTASCDTFYIVPTPSSHCPGEFTGVPCLTLDQYASNSSQSQNITFLVEPGTYNLSTILTVSNGYNFTMSSTNATVVCTSSTAQFVFNTVENVHISGMTFQRCRNNYGAIQMSSIMRANIVNCHIIENSGGGAIQMSNVTMSSIENCHFGGYDYSYNSVLSSTSRGGALYVTSSLVSISDCRFQNNYVYDAGGAICAISSHITINGSTFNYNRASYGGGIYSYSSTVIVDNTTFSQNSADVDGGAIYHDRRYIHSRIIRYFHVTNSVFSDNRAERSSGAIYMYTFSYTLYQYIIIIGCQFINNYASTSGGAVYETGVNDVLVVERNYYANNTANSFGGALYVVGENCSISVSGSSFIDNTAVVEGGGAIYSNGRYTNVTLSSSTFTNNSASYCGVLDVDNYNHRRSNLC